MLQIMHLRRGAVGARYSSNPSAGFRVCCSCLCAKVSASGECRQNQIRVLAGSVLYEVGACGGMAVPAAEEESGGAAALSAVSAPPSAPVAAAGGSALVAAVGDCLDSSSSSSEEEESS